MPVFFFFSLTSCRLLLSRVFEKESGERENREKEKMFGRIIFDSRKEAVSWSL